MRKSQKDFLYMIGSLGFALMFVSDIKNSWQMLLFMLAFAGLNFYNYIRHKRNEKKWDDILDDMYDDDDEDNRNRNRKRKKKGDKDKFESYIKNIEAKFGFDDDDDEEEEEEDEDDEY